MYGLLLEAILDYIKKEYGEEVWETIQNKANLNHTSFVTHNIYSENTIPEIAAVTSSVTGVPIDELMDAFGVSFVQFVGQYGYDRILKVLGRHMRDFLNGLDNLHEYLRFSYPKLKPPSFFCESENKNGLTLHYRSRRKGFLHYVKGQIRQVGKMFYNTKVDIYVITEEEIDNMVHVVFRLFFDNKAFKEGTNKCTDSIVNNIPLNSESLFELFPFHIVFSRYLEIRNVGSGLAAVMPHLVGSKFSSTFSMSRPLVEFSWEGIMAHTNNVFEIYSVKCVKRKSEVSTEDGSIFSETDTPEDEDKVSIRTEVSTSLHLKGQMMYMLEWDSMMFLATPVMDSLDDMFKAGLYINDLSMHDSSRDLVLAGTQQSAELKLALDQEQEKSRLLEQSMQKLDVEMKRTDALLYQMIPKPVADRLRKGEPSVNTCEVFDHVTILFSDVVGFTTICSKITPMEVVSMLNAMYTNFDKLSEKHKVYKVETIGDAYMGVSGAPIKTKFHALYVCDMALDMVDSMKGLTDPSTGQNMKIRVGIHSGTAVAGVVGIKMPRYCLFGDAVNTASRMETNGEAMKIHISEVTKDHLSGYPYVYTERGSIELKGKGSMKTYWLISRNDEGIDGSPPKCPFASAYEDSLESLDDHEEDRMSSRTVYSPVSFEDISKTQKMSPQSSPYSNSPKYSHSTQHISNYQYDSTDQVVSIVSETLPPSPPTGCPFSNHSTGKQNSLTFSTPVNLPTPVKQNNILNNNDKISCEVAIEDTIQREDFLKETKVSPVKQKEVNQMIKNALRPSVTTEKSPIAIDNSKKEASEKPKSQTCSVL